MNPNALFLRTLSDIENRLTMSDPYEVLLIAGLLRKLFLDDFPLVDQVNRVHRIKLEFEVALPSGRPKPEDSDCFWTVQDGLDPDTAAPGKPRQVLSRDQFFSETVTVIFGRVYSVRDIIQFEANVAGAVHAGAPKSDKEKALHELGASLGVGGYSPSLRQLLAIARVSLKALGSLRIAAA